MTRRVCTFCQNKSRTLTSEHIFPDWLSKKFSSGIFGIIEVTSDDGKKTWKKPLFQDKANIVCADCNNGWMSDIETAAKPILEKLILTLDSTLLAENEQKILALWAQKTVLVINKTTGGKFTIPQSFYTAIYESKTEPTNILVNFGWRMLASASEREPIASFYIKQIGGVQIKKEERKLIEDQMVIGKVAWTSTLTIGYLVLQLFAHDMQGILEIMGGDQRLMTVANPFVKSIDWPLEWPIEAVGGLDAIIRGTDESQH
jgi:hypothetical protein